MSFIDPYQAYVEASLTSGGPLQLVIAMYEAAVAAIGQARHCLASGDVWGRNREINKANDLLTELLVSLDFEKGGEISLNLQNLYAYLLGRLLEAHTRQLDAPLAEAEKLMGTMLEGWRGAAEQTGAMPAVEAYGSGDYAFAGVSEMF